MKPRQADERTVCGPCQIGECGHCDGNVDLRPGPGPAVPLTRCGHRCGRGRIQTASWPGVTGATGRY